MKERRLEFITKSAEETILLGEAIGKSAAPGLVLALSGDLGAGKTQLVKGIAKGLGITETVTSPTFTILQSYETGRLPLHHLDVYRIEDEEEMEEVGLWECMDTKSVTVIEWAGRIADLLPKETVTGSLLRETREGEECRRIIFSVPEGTVFLPS